MTIVSTQSCYHVPSSQARIVALAVMRHAEVCTDPGWDKVLQYRQDALASLLETVGVSHNSDAAITYMSAIVRHLD
jgi:hypothetical protein